jgi:hypothetical protein
MPETLITVRGIPEVQRNLAAFPKVLVVRCFAKAFSRAAAVFEAELRIQCPESDFSTSSEEYGHLVDNLTDEITIDTQGRGGHCQIGFGRKGFLALWIEYGHRIVTRSGKDTGKRVPAQPFMRKSFDIAADKALEVFVEAVQEFMREDAQVAA